MEKKTKKTSVIDEDVSKSAKQKALETAIEQIEKTYGKGSIMKLSDTNIDHVDVISTGCIAIDLALGRNPAVRLHCRCTSLPKRKKPAVMSPLSMLNMRLIPFMHRTWE